MRPRFLVLSLFVDSSGLLCNKITACEQKRFVMINEWVRKIKENIYPESLDMILVHNGIVRDTAKDEN
jgi:hypothetical protein